MLGRKERKTEKEGRSGEAGDLTMYWINYTGPPKLLLTFHLLTVDRRRKDR